MSTYDDRRTDNEPTRAQLGERVAELQREVERLTDALADAGEALRDERADRARTLAALLDCHAHVQSAVGAQHAIGLRAAYAHAADLVARGGR